MICFIGDSFAPQHLKAAAVLRGFYLTPYPDLADVVFVSQDTATDASGKRDLAPIRELVRDACRATTAPVVLTSQVPPGFTRSLKLPIYHQAETLRVKDAPMRALNPEQHIIGCEHPDKPLPDALAKYLLSFECPIHKMTWEEAELAKIAINMTLASQVENTNRLAAYADKVGARWEVIANVLKHDRRIGPHAYLDPGDWKKSPHLLRDWWTMNNG